MDGDGYVSNDGNSTSDLSSISVTAWVNPDYSGGSAEFTVISKEKSFALTINNNIEPQHIAKFAVFDGIKWHSVETATEIGNDWSHIAATFNGTLLSIYTNGTLSNVNESIETISVTLDGQLEPKTIETVSSTSDVVVGASLENQRSVDDVTKQFYGEIKEVNIFDLYLSAQQVAEIYLQTLPMIESLYNNTTIEIIEEEKEIEIIDVLASTTITNATNVNGTNTTLTNATDTILTFNDTQDYIPIVEESLNNELNKLTISTWINPDHTIDSTEYTIVSKENSFVLGINNVHSPERVPTFAVFDGITWTKITGQTQINDWSHLVAVINGTEISLYLNDNLEAQTTLPESFTILEGEVSPVSAEIAEKDSNLIIGAYFNTLRSKITLSNHFSGIIDDVLVYKEALSDAEINQIYLELVNPSVEASIPFESQLLSFIDHVTITLNDVVVSDTIIVAPINSTSSTPTSFQSLSIADYVSYKLNGSTLNSSVDVMILSDVVIATVIPAGMNIDNHSESLSLNDSIILEINGKSLAQLNNTSQTEAISIEDNVITALNGLYGINFFEVLSLNATITTSNYTTPTSNILSDIELGHSTVEVGKSVIWTQNVTFSNATDSVAIEIPADAEILSIQSINATTETVIFDSKDYETQNATESSAGLYDDADISEKDLKKYFRLLDSVGTIEAKINETNAKIAYFANLDTAKAHNKLDKLEGKLDKLEDKLDAKLDKLEQVVPMASLHQVEEMLQEDMPLKVLLLNDTAENLELTFMTPAPYTQEADNSTNGKYAKKITVTHDSALHYTNVTAFSPVPENLVEKGVKFSLFWNINGSKVDVTNDERFALEYVDTDGNGIADQLQWTVPQLSEQEFDVEAEIKIINVQSYPVVGGMWKVRFITNGTADLIITASNGTTFGDALPDDLKFLELNNGTHTLDPIWDGQSHIYHNYTSTEEGFELSRVMTPGKHHIMFQFGNDTVFAHNSARVPGGPQAFLMHGTPNQLFTGGASADTKDNMSVNSIMTMGWSAPADREDPIFSQTSSPCTTAGTCDVVTVSEEGMYRINYGATITQDTEGRYKLVSFVQNDTNGGGSFGTENYCHGSGWTRDSNGITEFTTSGECLLPLEANGEVRIGLSKVSQATGTANPSFNTDENWLHIQKVENPTAILRTTTDQSISIDSQTVPHIMTFGTGNIEQIDPSTFNFDDTNDALVAEKAGAYRVSYGVFINNLDTAGQARFGAIGLLQTNATGSFVASEYGRNSDYLRETDTADLGAIYASTILELDVHDAVRLGILQEDDFTASANANRYHLDIEYLGALSDVQILRLHDDAGGDDLEVVWGQDPIGNKRFMMDVIDKNVFNINIFETLDFVDNLERVTSVSLVENLTFDEKINLDAPINLFGTLTFDDKVTKFVALTETLSISDSITVNKFGPVIGDPSTLYGLNGDGDCDDQENHSSYQVETMGPSYLGCTLDDDIIITSSTTTEESLALFHLPYTYNADAQIQGLNVGNKIGFRTRDVDGTLHIKLVEVDISGTPIVNQVVATQSYSNPNNNWFIITDISGLTVVIDDGFALGFEFTFEADTASSNRKYIKYGEDLANQREVRVELDVQLQKEVSQSLSISDKVNLVIPVSLKESLNISDRYNQNIAVDLDQTLSINDELAPMKQAVVSLDDSVNIVDVIDTTKFGAVSLEESLLFTDVVDTTKQASVSLEENVTIDDGTVETVAAVLLSLMNPYYLLMELRQQRWQ